MNLLEEIKSSEELITDTHNRINYLETNGGLEKLFKLGRTQKRLKKLEDLQFFRIDHFLKSSNSTYQEFIDRNYELLETPKIHFTVYSTGMSFLGNRSKQVDGDIYPNGYSYSYSSKSNIAILPFDSMSFPSKMVGNVDYWGRLTLKVTRTNYSFMKSLPKRFEGFVERDGYVEIDNVENNWEVTQGTTMGKLIANHFEYDEQKNEIFQSNRDVLRCIINDFWEEIKNR